MKNKIFASFLVICFFNLFVTPAFALNNETKANLNTSKAVKVVAGTAITVRLLQSLNSKKNLIGDKVEAVVEDDVIVRTTKVFKKGAKVSLTVANVEKADFCGIPGEIVLVKGKVNDINNEPHEILLTKTAEGNERVWAKVLFGAFVFTGGLLLPFGLFWFVKGGNAKLPQNILIEAETKEEFYLY